MHCRTESEELTGEHAEVFISLPACPGPTGFRLFRHRDTTGSVALSCDSSFTSNSMRSMQAQHAAKPAASRRATVRQRAVQPMAIFGLRLGNNSTRVAEAKEEVRLAADGRRQFH